MSDPYMPLERELGLTRAALGVIERYGFGVGIITKSDLILRDIDLLARINEKAKCVVQMTLTTFDEELCRRVEPNVCSTKRRAEVLRILRDNGIPTVVWLSPILPFLNDTRENVEGILEYSAETGVYGAVNFGMGVTLRSGDREYYYRMLDKIGSGLSGEYKSRYGGAYEVLSPRHKELTELFNKICDSRGIERDNEKIFEFIGAFEEKEKHEQLSFL